MIVFELYQEFILFGKERINCLLHFGPVPSHILDPGFTRIHSNHPCPSVRVSVHLCVRLCVRL